MKKKFTVALVLALALVFGCSSDTNSGGGGGGGGYSPNTATYSGTTSTGDLFSLEIANNAKVGDSFEFTWTSSNDTKTSTGTIKEINGNEFTMLPSNAATPNTTFTTTVTDEGLTYMSGEFTWTDGSTTTGSGTLTPVAPPTQPSSSSGSGSGAMTWTVVDVSGIFDDNDINSIAYGNDTWVAVGDYGKMAYSTDNGKTWTAVTDSKFSNTYEGNINTIAYGNGTFVAGGGKGTIAYSADNGKTWTAVINYPFTEELIGGGTFAFETNAIAYGNGTFVAVSYRGKIAYSIDDGKTWTTVADSKFSTGHSTEFDEGDIIETIAYGDGKFVAGSFRGKMAYSTDGKTWTAVTDSKFSSTEGDEEHIKAIAYGNGTWVAVGASTFGDRKSAYSSNGTIWTAGPNPLYYGSFSVDAIAYGGNIFVAGGTDLAYSSDGKNWGGEDGVHSIRGFTHAFAIAYGNGTWVVGGTDGKIAYSTGN